MNWKFFIVETFIKYFFVLMFIDFALHCNMLLLSVTQTNDVLLRCWCNALLLALV